MPGQGPCTDDIFISHSQADRRWVDQWLIPHLKREGLKVRTERDFIPGIERYSNLENAVETCRYVFLIITPAWLQSTDAQYAERLARHRESPRGRIIPIIRKQCELPLHLKMLTPVHLIEGEAEDDETELKKLIRVIRGTSEGQIKEQRQIPKPPMTFAGRKTAISRLCSSLTSHADSDVVVALLGISGVGKTALAMKVANKVSRRFPGGVLWLTLGPEAERIGLVESIESQLGIPARRSVDVSERAQSIRFALAQGPRLLAVLDDVWTADLGKWILTSLLPNDRAVLITTHSRSVAAELCNCVERLDPLSEADAVKMLRNHLGTLGEDEGAAREVCALVGCLPLALCVSVGPCKVGLTNLPELAKWLHDDKRVLEGPGIGKDESRETGVAASFALAYDRLGSNLQQRFRALGAFEYTPYGLDALAAIWGDDSQDIAERAVRRLADIMLIDRSWQQCSWDAHPPSQPIYEQHRLLWIYAKKLLDEASDGDAIRLRHARYYIGVANQLASQLENRYDAESVAQFEFYRPQFMAAHEFLCKSSCEERLTLLYELHSYLHNCYDRSGRWEERCQILEEAVRAYETGPDSVLHERGALELQLSDIYRRSLEDLDMTLQYYRAGMEHVCMDKLPARLSIGRLHRRLGDIHRARGEFASALACYDQARGLLLQVGDRSELGKLLSSQAEAYCRSGISLNRAVEAAVASLELHRDRRDTYEVVQSQRVLADVYLAQGKVPEAAIQIQQAYDALVSIGQESNPIMGWVLRTWGDVHLQQDEPAPARLCYERAIDIFRGAHVGIGTAVIQKKLGLWELEHGNAFLALELLESAVDQARGIAGAKYLLGEVLLSWIEAAVAARHALAGEKVSLSLEEQTDLANRLSTSESKRTEFCRLVQESADLEILAAWYAYVQKREAVMIGVADSVSKRPASPRPGDDRGCGVEVADSGSLQDSSPPTFDTIDAVMYAAQNRFRLLQVYLNAWTAEPAHQAQLVGIAQRAGVRLMCHAPGLLGRTVEPEEDFLAHAREIMRDTDDKWIVHHFNEIASTEAMLKSLERSARFGLVPCIENYHQQEGSRQAQRNYEQYLELIRQSVTQGLRTCAVLDIPRLYHAKLGWTLQESQEQLLNVCRQLSELEIPILLHLIDSRSPQLERSEWCPLGEGRIPYKKLLVDLFATVGHIEAVVLEYEDEQNPLKSRSLLEESIRAAVTRQHPKLAVRWIG